MANEIDDLGRKYFRETLEQLIDLTPEQQAVVLKMQFDGLCASLVTLRGDEATASFLERMAERIRGESRLN